MSKRILQFWSGGADSTYLLLQNLRCKYHIECAYIEIKNNQEKTKREKQAMELLKGDIEKFCDYFDLLKPKYLEPCSINIEFAREMPVAPQQVTFATFSLLLGRDYDEVQLGIVLGDDSRGATLFEDMRNSYLNMVGDILSDEQFPHVVMPIADTSKEVIYLTLKGYDEAIGTDFINHLTCCEAPTEEVCGKNDYSSLCKPCKTRLQVYKNLGWYKDEEPKDEAVEEIAEVATTEEETDDVKASSDSDWLVQLWREDETKIHRECIQAEAILPKSTGEVKGLVIGNSMKQDDNSNWLVDVYLPVDGVVVTVEANSASRSSVEYDPTLLIPGDYVEGIEWFGDRQRIMRGWISKIGSRTVEVRADDSYYGCRGSAFEQGTIKLLENKKQPPHYGQPGYGLPYKGYFKGKYIENK